MQNTKAEGPASHTGEETGAARNLTARQRLSMLSRRRRQSADASEPSPSPSAQPAPASTPELSGAESGTGPAQTQAAEPNPSDSGPPAAPEPEAPIPSPSTSSPEPVASEPDSAPPADSAEPEASLEFRGPLPGWLQEILEQAKTSDGRSLNRSLVKRIGQLTAENSNLRELVGSQDNPPPEQPDQATAEPEVLIETAYSWHPQIKKLDARISELDSWVNWAYEHPEGGAVEDKNGKSVEITAEQIQFHRPKWERELSRLEGAKGRLAAEIQQQQIQARQQSLQEAQAAYPWLNDPQSAEYQEANRILRERPGLLNDPNWPMLLGDYVAGKQLRQKPKHSAIVPQPMSRPKSGATPTPVVAASATTPPKINPLQSTINDAEAEYRRTGSVKSREKLSALRRRLREQPATL